MQWTDSSDSAFYAPRQVEITMRTARRILVLGGGFAGLWAALGAARQREQLGIPADRLEITLVNRDAWHSIRVRNYEADLTGIRVPLDSVLGPAGVRRLEGEVVDLSPTEQTVTLTSSHGGSQVVSYDCLIFALGSELRRPPLPGLAQFGFDVDTYAGAARLQGHLKTLHERPASPGRFTVLVVGAGLTGIEVATEMVKRLRGMAFAENDSFRVILADNKPRVGSDMGESAIPLIETALQSLGIETRVGVEIASLDDRGAYLRSGEEIPAENVIWCGAAADGTISGGARRLWTSSRGYIFAS
jgi:NADH:ubiquinone reductase (H+-translocating)